MGRSMRQAYQMFRSIDINEDGMVSIEELSLHLGSDAAKEYFKTIDVDISEANCLFTLLDVNNGGSIDFHEFLSGCIRLNGPAKAVDLLLLARDIRNAFEKEQLSM